MYTSEIGKRFMVDKILQKNVSKLANFPYDFYIP